MTRTFVLAAAVLAFIGVALGAFGAHGLRAHFDANPTLESSFETAARYQMYHALALLAVAWLASRWPTRLVRWAGWLFIVGIILFSGSLYILSIANIRIMGAVAPLGGLAFLAGWACLFAAAWQNKE
jgi:uncharacterized membrane protein YgdD (TMEM256/DUF423 family)